MWGFLSPPLLLLASRLSLPLPLESNLSSLCCSLWAAQPSTVDKSLTVEIQDTHAIPSSHPGKPASLRLWFHFHPHDGSPPIHTLDPFHLVVVVDIADVQAFHVTAVVDGVLESFKYVSHPRKDKMAIFSGQGHRFDFVRVRGMKASRAIMLRQHFLSPSLSPLNVFPFLVCLLYDHPHSPAANYASSSGAGHSLSAPMPGKVIKILTENGATVKKGQPLLILEAMKMEVSVPWSPSLSLSLPPSLMPPCISPCPGGVGVMCATIVRWWCDGLFHPFCEDEYLHPAATFMPMMYILFASVSAAHYQGTIRWSD